MMPLDGRRAAGGEAKDHERRMSPGWRPAAAPAQPGVTLSTTTPMDGGLESAPAAPVEMHSGIARAPRARLRRIPAAMAPYGSRGFETAALARLRETFGAFLPYTEEVVSFRRRLQVLMKSPWPTHEIVLDVKYRLEECLGEGATGVVYRALPVRASRRPAHPAAHAAGSGGLLMKTLLLAGLCVLLCLPLCHGFAEEAPPSEPVALVYWLRGEATLTVPSESRRSLRLFERLPSGTTVEVGPGSRLALAFANGRRYELGERSRATLGPADLSLRSGPVRPLQSVPPLPRLLPIADEEQPGLRAGAVRIRAERIAGLYPSRGAATLAGSTAFRFEPVEGAGTYQVEVQDRQGNVILATEATASPVTLPAGVLQPGTRYHWTVRTIERVGPVAKGEADFVTLPSGLAQKREELRRVVEAAGDDASLALLAEIDRSLGLWAEACDELRAALRGSPGDATLTEALAEIERRLPYLQSP